MSSRNITKKNLNEMIITGKERGTVQQKSSGKIPLQIHSLLFSILIYTPGGWPTNHSVQKGLFSGF